jgi:hypothetical protein
MVGSLVPGANGGALISKMPIPDGTAEAEVLATVALLHSGGVYTEYLQASPNAHTGPQRGGAYLAFEMQNPTFDSAGHCAANFLVLQGSASGAVSLFSSFPHACRNGMTMRFAVRGTTALVWPDQAKPVEFSVTAAIGSYNAPAGNAISPVQLGSIARAIPAAIDQRTIGVSAFRNRVDVQWKPVALDAASAGINGYWICRAEGNRRCARGGRSRPREGEGQLVFGRQWRPRPPSQWVLTHIGNRIDRKN